MSWKRSRVAGGEWEEEMSATVPRGCVALMVGEGGRGGEERVVVEVGALGQPRVRALLEKAAREFGYGQKGVLRVPCSADELRRAVAADAAAAAAGSPRRGR